MDLIPGSTFSNFAFTFGEVSTSIFHNYDNDFIWESFLLNVRKKIDTLSPIFRTVFISLITKTDRLYKERKDSKEKCQLMGKKVSERYDSRRVRKPLQCHRVTERQNYYSAEKRRNL